VYEVKVQEERRADCSRVVLFKEKIVIVSNGVRYGFRERRQMVLVLTEPPRKTGELTIYDNEL